MAVKPDRDGVTIESVREAVAATALVGKAFVLCQPDCGDVFSWIDDHRIELARAVLDAVDAERAK